MRAPDEQSLVPPSEPYGDEMRLRASERSVIVIVRIRHALFERYIYVPMLVLAYDMQPMRACRVLLLIAVL